jgi:hypothetical protein
MTYVCLWVSIQARVVGVRAGLLADAPKGRVPSPWGEEQGEGPTLMTELNVLPSMTWARPVVGTLQVRPVTLGLRHPCLRTPDDRPPPGHAHTSFHRSKLSSQQSPRRAAALRLDSDEQDPARFVVGPSPCPSRLGFQTSPYLLHPWSRPEGKGTLCLGSWTGSKGILRLKDEGGLKRQSGIC